MLRDCVWCVLLNSECFNNSRDIHANILFHNLWIFKFECKKYSYACAVLNLYLKIFCVSSVLLLLPSSDHLKRINILSHYFSLRQKCPKAISLSSRCLRRASHDQRFRTIIRMAKSGKKVKSFVESISKVQDAYGSRFTGSCSQRICDIARPGLSISISNVLKRWR